MVDWILGRKAPLAFDWILGRKAPLAFDWILGRKAPLAFDWILGRKAPLAFDFGGNISVAISSNDAVWSWSARSVLVPTRMSATLIWS